MANIVTAEERQQSEFISTIDEREKIERAVQWINDHIERVCLKGTLDIGNYVLKEFFNDDPEEASSTNPRKEHSFLKLQKHPQLRMSRTKLQNAVGIAILKRNAGELDIEDFHVSYLVALLPLKNDPHRLRQMIHQIRQEDLTYRKIDNAVRKALSRSAPEITLGDIQKSMNRFFSKFDRFIATSNDFDRDEETVLAMHDHIEKTITELEKLKQKLAKLNQKE